MWNSALKKGCETFYLMVTALGKGVVGAYVKASDLTNQFGLHSDMKFKAFITWFGAGSASTFTYRIS